MTTEEARAKLREAQIKHVAIQHQTDGIKQLYSAAIAMSNNQLSDTYRQQLHDLLDTQLDNSSEIMELSKASFLI